MTAPSSLALAGAGALMLAAAASPGPRLSSMVGSTRPMPKAIGDTVTICRT